MTLQPSPPMQKLRHLSVWFVASVLGLAASSIGLSRVLEAELPSAALVLNPLNEDALVNKITGQLNDTDTPPDLEALAAEAKKALRYDLADARLYSLIGEIELRRGDKERAYQLFDQAQKLSKTEIHSLQRSIDRSIETGDLAKAVDEIDILLRRWPDRFPLVASGFPTILANPSGYRAVLKAIGADAPWRGYLFSTLVADPLGIGLANRLLLDMAGSSTPPTDRELSSVIAGFIRQRQYGSAYRLFLFSLTDEQRKLGGYVYNSTFEPYPSGKPFDWQVPSQVAVEVTFSTSHDAVEGEGGATVRFLNAPVKNDVIPEYLQLPPGAYRLSLLASGRNLKLPKGLFWSLRCIDPAGEVGRLNIPEGTYNRKSFNVDFTVNPDACPIQLLRLEAATIADSWRFRYVGSIVMHKISIERVSS
ncbi:MAG: hypothetical protein J0J15_18275 [Mesorhizobium sp.]|nr:hypothetical protein [Mesorhizobium sp.]